MSLYFMGYSDLARLVPRLRIDVFVTMGGPSKRFSTVVGEAFVQPKCSATPHAC